MSLVLRNCRAVVTPITPKSVEVLENVNISIDGDSIVNVSSSIPKSQTIIDCSEFVVLPGFSDCHTHLVSAVASSEILRIECDEARNFMESYKRYIAHEGFYHAAKILFLKSLIAGTTLISIYEIPIAHIDKLVKEKLLRSFFASSIRNTQYFHMYQYSKELLIFFTYLESDCEDAVQKLKELKRRGLRIAIHLPLSGAEVLEFRSKYGYFPVEFLNKFSILSPNTSLLHADWMTSWEMQLISRNDTSVVISPVSTAIYGCKGFIPINEMIEQGISVGLGTDLGLACGLNIIEMFKILFMLYRHSYGDLRIGIETAFYIATAGGYKVLGLDGGIIKPGYLADLILVNSDHFDIEDIPYSLLALKDNFIEAVIVGGKIVYSRDQRRDILRIIENEKKYLRHKVLRS